MHAAGIDAWLAAQLEPATLPDPQGDAAWAAIPLAQADPATIRASVPAGLDAAHAFGNATLAQQMWSSRQLFEVVVDSGQPPQRTDTGARSWDVGSAYHRDVIRAALGSFADMLVAAGRHPAMLRYLTADRSKKDSVNENYGRELLELHTVGVASGYTEQDVNGAATSSPAARWSPRRGMPTRAPSLRPRDALGGTGDGARLQPPQPDPEGGLDVGDAYLRHLAGTPPPPGPSWLAVRFVSDMPPPALVDRLATAYLEAGTAIVPVLDLLFRSAEFWAAVGQKTRRPAENVAHGVRILGTVPEGDPVRSIAGLANVACARRSAGRLAGAQRLPRRQRRVALGHGPPHLLEPASHADQRLGGRSLPSRPRGHGRRGHDAATLVDNLCARTCFQAFQPAHRDALVAFLGATRPPRSGTTWQAPPSPSCSTRLLRPPVRSSDMTRPTTDHRCGPDPEGPGELRRLGPTPGDGAVRAAPRPSRPTPPPTATPGPEGCRAVRSCKRVGIGGAALGAPLVTARAVVRPAGDGHAGRGVPARGLDGLSVVVPAADPTCRPPGPASPYPPMPCCRRLGLRAPSTHSPPVGPPAARRRPRGLDPRPVRSHFQAQDWSGAGPRPAVRGWLDRVLDAMGPGTTFRPVGRPTSAAPWRAISQA